MIKDEKISQKMIKNKGKEIFMKKINRFFFLHEWAFAASLMIIPLVILFVLFIYPLLSSFTLSFYRRNLVDVAQAKFIGLANYINALTSSDTLSSIGVTLIFVVGTVTLCFLLGLILALLLDTGIMFQNIYRGLLLIPWAMPAVIISLMWMWLFDGHFGLLSYIFGQLGFGETAQNMLLDKKGAMIAVIIAQSWKNTPFMALLILGGLQTVPKNLKEAAKLDGASSWRILTRIILPYIKEVLIVVLIIGTMWSFQAFDTIITMTRGGPTGATNVMSLLTYRNVFSYFRFGYGSALGYLMVILIIPFLWLYLRQINVGDEKK